MKVGRNDPCPCGSGKKYKRCHLAQDEKDEADARATRAADGNGPGAHLIRRGDQRFLASDGIGDEALELAQTYFDQRDAGDSPAQQMMVFAEPLMDLTDGSPESLDKAMAMAVAFWNLAILPKHQRETSLLATAETLGGTDQEQRATFLDLARLMIERHEDMFPELHVTE